MPASPVLYEVNLTVAQHRAAEFDVWLREHVAQMLELPGFVDAATMNEAADDSAIVRRSVHYQLRDQAALDLYFEEHAERMRAAGLERFGDDLSASRRTLSAQPVVSAEHCANCANPLAGQYCASCGQRHRTRMISVFELTRDVFEDVFRWDSRLWRSVRPLLLSPGKLTNEYLDGRRAYYTPPLRMYLVLSIAFFLITSLPALQEFNAANMLGVQVDEDGADLAFSRENFDAARDRPSVAVVAGETERDEVVNEEADSDDDTDDDADSGCNVNTDLRIPGISDAALKSRLEQLCRRITSKEGGAAFTNEFADLAPKLLIIMLPLIALTGKLLYPMSRRFYVEHLLFYTHFHSFVFLLLLLIIGITTLGAALPVIDINSTFLNIAAGLYVTFYFYRALRLVFKQGRMATLLKMFLIWLSYLIGTLILALIGAAIAALSL